MVRDAGALIPSGLNLIVISRAEPPAPLARLRTHGDLIEIGWDDLRLSAVEAQQLADIRRGAPVAPEFVEQCQARARGWIAGLVLLLEQTHPERAAMRAGPNSGVLFDYFAGEIFTAAGAMEPLAAAVQHLAPILLAQGRHHTLGEWIAVLPPELLDHNGWLRYWRAAVWLGMAPRQARQDFLGASERFEAASDVTGLYLAWAGVVESYLIEWGDFTGLDDCLQRFLELRVRHPEFPSPEVEMRVHMGLLTLIYRQPGHPELPAWAERARCLLDTPGHEGTRLGLCVNLINYHLWKGEFN